MRVKRIERRKTILVAAVVLAMSLLFVSIQRRPGESPGSPKLVSIEPLPDGGGEMCLWEPELAGRESISAAQENNLFGAFAQGSVYAAAQGAGQTGDVTRPPLRKVMDTDPIYTAVTVDTRLNEVLLQDTN